MRERLIVGIDADTAQIAWAAFQNGRHIGHGTILRTRVVRGRRIFDADYLANVRRFLERCREREARVFVEDVYLGANPATFKALSRVAGEIFLLAHEAGVCVEFVAPVKWQRAVLGVARGREAIQTASFEKAEALVGAPVESEHEADAINIAAHGAGLCVKAGKPVGSAASCGC